MSINKFLILGGDLRSIHLYNLLNTEANKVKITGFSTYQNKIFPSFMNISNLSQALENVEVIIGPTPCSSNGGSLNTPFNDVNISAEELFSKMKKNQIFIAGRINNEIKALAETHNIKVYDILEREEMVLLNAIPSAEGAIQLAMENLDITIHDCNALVLGYGRIGNLLCKLLKSMGANVYAASRSYKDDTRIKMNRYNSVGYDELISYLPKMDLIINTVPSILLDKSNLKFINHNCFIIDLASKPFGVDIEESKKEGLNVMWAPSLPGKVAPKSAARYIKDTVFNILNELEG